MRWTLIPQRIGFMSGFALFWMLAADLAPGPRA